MLRFERVSSEMAASSAIQRRIRTRSYVGGARVDIADESLT